MQLENYIKIDQKGGFESIFSPNPEKK